MRIVYEYSHLDGSEILQVRYPAIQQQVSEIISRVTARRAKVSKEKTMQGRLLFSPVDMNQQFKDAFASAGYHEIRDTYTITIPNSDVAISNAFKQIDFVKERVLVEVQFGKYAFMFYDMAKFQYFFNENKADVGIEIVPSEAARARRNVATLGTTNGVAEVIAADGIPWLERFDGIIDLLYLDADGPRGKGKSIYLDLLLAATHALRPGSLVLAHNSFNSASTLVDYLDYVRDPAHLRESANMIVDDQGLEVSIV